MDEGEGDDWIGELRSFINSQDNVNQEGDDNALPYNSKSIIEPDMQASCTNEDDVYLSRTDVILNNQKLDQSGLRWMSCRKSRCIVCAVNSCHVMSHMRKRDGSLYKLYRMPGSKLKREEWIEAMGNADPDFVPPFTTSTAALQTNFQVNDE